IEYSDAVEYAIKIRGQGWAKVSVISDVSVCSFFGPRASARNDTFVLLGADGLDHDGNVSGTIGTRTIAAAAKQLGGNVYVLAEGGKVRDKLPDQSSGDRGHPWFTADPRITAMLRSQKIDIPQPHNEIVEAELIDGFITEESEGDLLTPEQFKAAYSADRG